MLISRNKLLTKRSLYLKLLIASGLLKEREFLTSEILINKRKSMRWGGGMFLYEIPAVPPPPWDCPQLLAGPQCQHCRPRDHQGHRQTNKINWSTDANAYTLKYPLLNWEGLREGLRDWGSERVTDYKFLSYLTKPGSYLPVVQAGLHLLIYCTCLEDNVIFRVDKYKLRLIYYIYPRTFLWTFSLHYVCLVSPSNRSLNL